MRILGVPDIRLVGPKTLLPHDTTKLGVSVYHRLEEGIADVDVVMMLRPSTRTDEKRVAAKRTRIFSVLWVNS